MGGVTSCPQEAALSLALPGLPFPLWPTIQLYLSPSFIQLIFAETLPYLQLIQTSPFPELPVYQHINRYLARAHHIEDIISGVGRTVGNSRFPGGEITEAGMWKEKGREITL